MAQTYQQLMYPKELTINYGEIPPVDIFSPPLDPCLPSSFVSEKYEKVVRTKIGTHLPTTYISSRINNKHL